MTNEKKNKQTPMTDKNSGLSSAQEVTYQDEFKKANQLGDERKKKTNPDQ